MELFIRGLSTSSEDKRGNGHIRNIDLSSNALSSQSLIHLVDIPARILRHLKEIKLCLNRLDRTGMDHIAKTIPHMPQLETLNLWSRGNQQRWCCSRCMTLSECGITATGGTALATSLLEITTLERLNIRSNALGGGEVIETFANVLQQNKTLEDTIYLW